jgi:hypothetical protein
MTSVFFDMHLNIGASQEIATSALTQTESPPRSLRLDFGYVVPIGDAEERLDERDRLGSNFGGCVAVELPRAAKRIRCVVAKTLPDFVTASIGPRNDSTTSRDRIRFGPRRKDLENAREMSQLECPATRSPAVHDCLADVLILEAQNEVELPERCVADTASPVRGEIEGT